MKKKLTALLSLPLLLAACVDKPGESPISSLPKSEDNQETFSSILEAVTYLKNKKNYTLDVVILQDGVRLEGFDVSYTETGYYFGIANGEYGYKSVSDGVFAYEIYGKEMYFSELLENDDGVKYADLWESHLFSSFADWSLDKLEAEKNGVVKAKDSRLSMLKMTGFDEAYYPYLDTASAKISDSGNFTFTFDLDTAEYLYTIKATVMMVGGSLTEKVDKALAGGKTYFTPSDSLKKARKLFKGDNFTHVYMDENGEEAAWEKFHPDYYHLTVDSAYNASHEDSPLIPYTFVKIDNKYVPGAKRVLSGIYYCTINGNSVALMVGPNGEGYNTLPDIVSFLHYPKTLGLWSCLEFSTLEKTPLEGYDETYSFSRIDLAEDAANNFGLSAVLASLNTSAYSVSLSLKNIDKGNAAVNFRIIAANGSYSDFYFTDFGKTSEAALDNLVSTFLDPSLAPKE